MYEKIPISIICVFFTLINTINCSTIIVFNSHEYRSGQFAFKENGDMIIEYSNDKDNYRLFYGLKKNGKFYFNNNSSFIETTATYNNNDTHRYEARNIFVIIDNKEYLFSIASDKSVAELWDLTEGNIVANKFISSTIFLGFNEYSYVFSLLEMDTTHKNFVISYLSGDGHSYNLQKFSFTNFGFNSNDYSITTTSEKYDINSFINRIVNCFIMNNEKIVVFLVGSSMSKFELYIYNYDLQPLNKGSLPVIDEISNFQSGVGLFSKAYHLENNDAIFIYFTKPSSSSLKLKIVTISEDTKSFTVKIEQYLNSNNDCNLNSLPMRNDFAKVNSQRFIYLGLDESTSKNIYIYLFDLYNDFNSLNIRVYQENFNGEHSIDKELSADVFNNHLIFTATAIKNSKQYSILMIFGYANYTDSIIDISEYFMDDEMNNSNNLVDKLLANITIENNIFNYYIDTNEIKLISIPEEIIFYNGNLPSNENKVSNGENLNRIYTFQQNQNKEKTDEFYFLDYQPIVKEPTYENYGSGTIKIMKGDNQNIYQNGYVQQIYYGRTITVKFKLCHEYCGTCLKYGKSDNLQLCESCLPDYSYFYGNEFNSNCVPDGYFYDKDNNILTKCYDSNSYFYINLTDNKRICFKNTLPCPDEYPFLNETNKECINLTFPVQTTLPEVPTTIPLIPTTIPIIPTTIPLIPTTIPKFPTTIPQIITTLVKLPTTIPEILTTIPRVQTTIPKLPTTFPQIITTIPEVLTTLPQIVTTVPKILTTVPEVVITTVPLIIPSKIPQVSTTMPIIQTIIPKDVLTTIIETEINHIITCAYKDILNNKCNFKNKTNAEIYDIIKKEILPSFPKDGESIVILGEDEYIFQVTNNINELSTINGSLVNGYNLSMIDLAICEIALREAHGIDNNEPLNLIKFEKLSNLSIEKNIQYEIYALNSTTKLNLSVCRDKPVDIYIPVELSKETKMKYDDLKSQGYHLFDKDSSFYTDICTPYDSENETDVPLSVRNSEFYNSTEVTCQKNCEYENYSFEKSFLKCVCSVVEEDIDTQEPEKYTGKTFITSFYDVLKNSNYEILKCYELAFRLINFVINIGSIVTAVLFFLYFIFLVAYIFTGINQIKKDIAKIISLGPKKSSFANKNNINNNLDKKPSKVKIIEGIHANNNNRNINKRKSHKINFKKPNSTSTNKDKKRKTHNYESFNIFTFQNIKNKHFPPKKNNLGKSKLINTNIINNDITIIKNSKEPNKQLKFGKSLLSNVLNKSKPKQKSLSRFSLLKGIKNNPEPPSTNIYKKNINNINNIKNNKNKNEYIYSDFEINELEYLEAIKYDKRTFFQIYISLLKREHTILFTFFSCNDYNLITIKLARFFFFICTDMAMNVFFFSDDSMHKIYKSYGNWDILQNIPQIIYSLIISQALQVFICFLTLSDKHVYQIKKLKYDKVNRLPILKTYRCIKIKLCLFFIISFIFFFGYWYIVTCFCAVYRNTQIIFIKDSLSSFLGGISYPFLLYLLPTLLRIISLKAKKKNLSCLYKLSDILPIF